MPTKSLAKAIQNTPVKINIKKTDVSSYIDVSDTSKENIALIAYDLKKQGKQYSEISTKLNIPEKEIKELIDAVVYNELKDRLFDFVNLDMLRIDDAINTCNKLMKTNPSGMINQINNLIKTRYSILGIKGDRLQSDLQENMLLQGLDDSELTRYRKSKADIADLEYKIMTEKYVEKKKVEDYHAKISEAIKKICVEIGAEYGESARNKIIDIISTIKFEE